MQNKNFWKIFENTGDVNDYINYKHDNVTDRENLKEDQNEPKADNNYNRPSSKGNQNG